MGAAGDQWRTEGSGKTARVSLAEVLLSLV
jgi:hypothetical protein